MAGIKKYHQALSSFLEYYASIKSPFMQEVENKIIIDNKSHQYQLLRLGWYKNKYVHYTVFHFEIKDKKVIIYENRTDLNIHAELQEVGILAKDIVSGMQHPSEKLLQTA